VEPRIAILFKVCFSFHIKRIKEFRDSGMQEFRDSKKNEAQSFNSLIPHFPNSPIP
jgi:hypothetical protein